MKISMGTIALATVVMGFSAFANEAAAVPNCATCVPAYESCVASGATNCDRTYAACIRYCGAVVDVNKDIVKNSQHGEVNPIEQPQALTMELRRFAAH